MTSAGNRETDRTTTRDKRVSRLRRALAADAAVHAAAVPPGMGMGFELRDRLED